MLINGQDIFQFDDTKLSDIRSRLIGFIFQSYNLVNRMSVQENVEFPAVFSLDRSSANKAARALELLQILGIKDKAKQKPVDLSGGEQQRVAIARALIYDPALILADEPTGNLDEENAQHVTQLLFGMNKEEKTTLVMVTHNLELAQKTERILQMKGGRIVNEILAGASVI